jgi:hypothetical protein
MHSHFCRQFILQLHPPWQSYPIVYLLCRLRQTNTNYAHYRRDCQIYRICAADNKETHARRTYLAVGVGYHVG